MDLPGWILQVDLSLEEVDAGDGPAELPLTRFQKRNAPSLGGSHIGKVIPDIDGIDLEWRDLNGTRFLSDRWFALDGFWCPGLVDERNQPRDGLIDLSAQFLTGLPLIGSRYLDCLNILGHVRELVLNIGTVVLLRFEPLVDSIGDGCHAAVDLSDLILYSSDL